MLHPSAQQKKLEITRCESRSTGQNWFVGMIFAKFILVSVK